MKPELFTIPFTDITVKSYGLMLVIGFIAAVMLMRKMARIDRRDPEEITNAALYAIVFGVIGARIFYVLHNIELFRNNWLEVFAVWRGGLEFIGGVFLAILVILAYSLIRKTSPKVYFDILATGLMLGLAFGRIGCLLNGCCFGNPTACPVAVRFPYDSHSYNSQIRPDLSRDRLEPHLDLPAEYFGFYDSDGNWVQADEANKYSFYLKPWELLTEKQRREVTAGEFRSRPVHPAQIYSSINALVLCGILLFYWYKIGRFKPGTTFPLMFILYGLTRFGLEFIREGNPYEAGWWTIGDSLTISQNIGIYLAAAGIVLFVFGLLRKSGKTEKPQGQKPPQNAQDDSG